MDEGDRRAAAELLLLAERDRAPVPPLTATFGDFSPEDAYAIQVTNIRRRVERGARIVGHKVGLTSPVMQTLMGVFEPDYGHLLDDMVLTSGAAIERRMLCQPRVEVEIAFMLGRPLRGPGVTEADVVRATEHITGAIEIIDSRIADWKLSLPDTIADNASSGLVVLGTERRALPEIDPRLNGVVLSKNGRIVETGASGAVLGSPVTAVAWLANKLADLGTQLEAGSVVMPGSCTAAVAADAGDSFVAEFDRLGTVSVTFS